MLPAVMAVGAWGARLLGAAKLASVLFALVKLYWFISLVCIAFWAAVAYFAKELVAWWAEVMLSLAGFAIEAAGVEDPGPEIVQLVNSLPPVILDLWARLNVWDSVAFLCSCFALNMALRSIPFVGSIFRG